MVNFPFAVSNFHIYCRNLFHTTPICCIDTWLQLLNRPCFLGEFLPSYGDSSCTSFTWHIPTTVELTGLLVTPNPADLRRQEGEEIQQKIGCLTKVIFQRHTLHRIFWYEKLHLSMRNHTFKQKYYSSILLQTQTVSAFVGLKSLKLQNEVVTSVTGIGPESFASGPIGWHWLCPHPKWPDGW